MLRHVFLEDQSSSLWLVCGGRIHNRKDVQLKSSMIFQGRKIKSQTKPGAIRIERWGWIWVIFICVNFLSLGDWLRYEREEKVKAVPEDPILGNLRLKLLWQWSHGEKERQHAHNLFVIRAMLGVPSCYECWSLLFKWEIQMEQEIILNIWGVSVPVSYFKKTVWLWKLDTEITSQTQNIDCLSLNSFKEMTLSFPSLWTPSWTVTATYFPVFSLSLWVHHFYVCLTPTTLYMWLGKS